jgi:hypothetical protein
MQRKQIRSAVAEVVKEGAFGHPGVPDDDIVSVRLASLCCSVFHSRCWLRPLCCAAPADVFSRAVIPQSASDT